MASTPKLLLGLVAGALTLSGCGSGGDLFPLAVGKEWNYSVRNGLAEYVQPMRVVREVPVAGTTGYELQGPMGLSRLAWKGPVLYATLLPNARIYPPLPMLVSSDKGAARSWSGSIYSSGKTRDAEATLRQSSGSITLGGKKYDVVKATLNIRMDGQEIEIETNYAEGYGPLTQIQRTINQANTSDQFDVALEYLGGP